MNYWPHLLAVLVGAGLTVQVGMNATVRQVIDSPLIATIVNFCVGLAALALLAVATSARMTPGSAAMVPAWAWLGGLLGAAYVAVTIVVGPRLGAAALVALTWQDRCAPWSSIPWRHRISAKPVTRRAARHRIARGGVDHASLNGRAPGRHTTMLALGTSAPDFARRTSTAVRPLRGGQPPALLVASEGIARS
jgi:hypothetical protein